MKKIILFLTILIISANLVSAALIAHYSFDEGDRDIVGDLAGTNTGTLYGNTKLLMSFDNQNAIDESGYGNDGKHYGNTRLLMDFDGGTADDKSVYDNDGTLEGQNGVVDCTVDGKSGNGCSFDGVDDYINLSIDTFGNEIDMYHNATISFWIKRRSQPGGESHFLNFEGIITFAINNSGNIGGAWDGAGGGIGGALYCTSTFPEDVWTHITLQRNHPNVTCYFNGEYDNSVNDSDGTYKLGDLSRSQVIGSHYKGGSSFFNGTLDEVAIYSKALDENEIRDIYNANKAKFTDWTTETKSGDGSALEFDGIDDYVDISKDVSDLSDYTIEAWVYFSSDNTQTFPGIVSMRTGNENDYSVGISFQFYDGGGGYYLDAEGAAISDRLPKVSANTVGEGISYDTWHHVALTVDRDGGAGGVIQYVDGVQSTTDTAVDNPTHRDDISIGARYYTNCDNPDNICDYFNGKIDEVAIYSKVLSPDEINQHYLDKKAQFTDWTTDTPPDLGGYALEFDGVNDYVDIGDIDELGGTTEFTATAWINPKKTSIGNSLIKKSGVFTIAVDVGRLQLILGSGSASFTWDYRETIKNNEWAHVAVVYDGSGETDMDKINLYYNGLNNIQFTTSGIIPTSISSNSNPVQIGSSEGGKIFWDGLIDELKIYDTALTQEQVQNEFSRGNAYWRPPPQPERFGAPGFIPNLFVILIVISSLLLLSYLNIRK